MFIFTLTEQVHIQLMSICASEWTEILITVTYKVNYWRYLSVSSEELHEDSSIMTVVTSNNKGRVDKICW
jgi:hypothetical protein